MLKIPTIIYRINLFFKEYKYLIEGFVGIIGIFSIVFIIIQNSLIKEQNIIAFKELKVINDQLAEMQKQNELIREQLKYAQFIERINFINNFLVNTFGKDVSSINIRLLKKEYSNIN